MTDAPSVPAHQLHWSSLLNTFALKEELNADPREHGRDYATRLIEGVPNYWCEERGAWNVRALIFHLRRLIHGARYVLQVDLSSQLDELLRAYDHLLAHNGVPGEDAYGRPTVQNGTRNWKVGTAVTPEVVFATGPMPPYLQDGVNAILWCPQTLFREHVWSVLKWVGNYAQAAVYKRLCDAGDIAAHEVLALSHMARLVHDWEQAFVSETSGSCLLVEDQTGTITAIHSRHLPLPSITVDIDEWICQQLGIRFERGDSTIGTLRRARKVMLAGSWTRNKTVGGLLVGQRPDILLLPHELERIAFPLAGHESRPVDVDWRPDEESNLDEVARQYDAICRGTSSLPVPEDRYHWVEPAAK